MKAWLRTLVVAVTVISTGCGAVGMPAAQARVATGVPAPTPRPIGNGELSGFNSDGTPKDEQLRSAPEGALVLVPASRQASTTPAAASEEDTSDDLLMTMLLVLVVGAGTAGVLIATGALD